MESTSFDIEMQVFKTGSVLAAGVDCGACDHPSQPVWQSSADSGEPDDKDRFVLVEADKEPGAAQWQIAFGLLCPEWLVKRAEARAVKLMERHAAGRVLAKIDEARRLKQQELNRANAEQARITQLDFNSQVEQVNKERAAKRLIEAWANYESEWAALPTRSCDPLWSFGTIPWPVVHLPHDWRHPTPAPGEISVWRIKTFLRAEGLADGISPADRLRAASARWDAERFFGQYLHKVRMRDRKSVIRGVRAVCKALEELQAAL